MNEEQFPQLLEHLLAIKKALTVIGLGVVVMAICGMFHIHQMACVFKREKKP